MSPGRSMTALDIGIQRVFYMIWWILYGRGRLGSKAGLLSRLLPETGAGFNQTKIRTYIDLIPSQIRVSQYLDLSSTSGDSTAD